MDNFSEFLRAAAYALTRLDVIGVDDGELQELDEVLTTEQLEQAEALAMMSIREDALTYFQRVLDAGLRPESWGLLGHRWITYDWGLECEADELTDWQKFNELRADQMIEIKAEWYFNDQGSICLELTV